MYLSFCRSDKCLSNLEINSLHSVRVRMTLFIARSYVFLFLQIVLFNPHKLGDNSTKHLSFALKKQKDWTSFFCSLLKSSQNIFDP